jgi:outer membrane protein OmpA-like peptidoglycan-associated protein
LRYFIERDAADGAPDEAFMDRGGMPSSFSGLLVTRAIPCLFAVALLAGAPLPAAAQTVVGSDRQPSVTVDEGVLDSLGPVPTLPDLLRGRLPERRAAIAHPRRGSALRRPAKKRTANAKRKKPEVAAHRAAPVAPVAVARGTKASNATTPAVPRDSVTAKPLAEPATPAAPAPPNPPAAQTATVAPPAAPSAPPAATAAAPPERPTVTAPTPPPTVAPSPNAEAAMNAPPAVPPAPPATPTPVAPAAAPAAVASGPTRVLFAGSGIDLPDTAKPELTALAQRLKVDDHLRVELVAHASGAADQANEARRISLQRALAVRTYLMEQGVAATRMDVRALGNRVEGEGDAGKPLDRVDVVMLDH